MAAWLAALARWLRWLGGWLSGCVGCMRWLGGWLVVLVVASLALWLAGWLFGWLGGWLVGWLFGWLALFSVDPIEIQLHMIVGIVAM